MTLIGIRQFEQLFRKAASLDVDKSDLRRLSDFVNGKVHGLLLRGRANAKANGRDIIQPQDLPITRGLQESVHAFRGLDETLELKPILEGLATLPEIGAEYSDEVEARLPEIVGGLIVALAKTFKIMEPSLKNPQTEHWDKAERIFDTLI